MAEQNRIPIQSEKDLRTHAVSVLRRVNSAERGGLLFLLNPVFALEEAGFDLSPSMRLHLRRGLRYGTKTKKRMRELEAEVKKIAGHSVNATADAEVAHLLFEELKLKVPRAKAKADDCPAPADQSEPLPVRDRIYEEVSDAETKTEGGEILPKVGRPALTAELMERLRKVHPVVSPLIELRQLSRTGWRFVDRATYEKVKNGANVTLLRRVRFTKQGKESRKGGS